ncbi:hypothetical protein K9L16_01585 [Candidatus Pacearchaeota archaeon]|nr:hypothetical protein [Candidatus Pacearchaeota archaeon]
MKKELLLIILILVFPLISSASIEMQDSFYNQETIFAKVIGTFTEPPQKENIFLYRNERFKVGFDFQISSVGDEYWISGNFQSQPDTNYTLVIKDTEYYITGGKISDLDIKKTFYIKNQTADFSLIPGFAISDETFQVNVKNLQASKINLQVSEESVLEEESDKTFEIYAGQTKTLDFKLKNFENTTIKNIKLSSGNFSYNFPIYILGEDTGKPKIPKFSFDPSEFEISVQLNSTDNFRYLYLKNTGNTTLKNITLSVSETIKDYVNLSVDFIEELDQDSTVKLKFYIYPPENPKKVDGQIKAKIPEDIYAYTLLKFNFTKSYVEFNYSEYENKSQGVVIDGSDSSVKEEKNKSDFSYGKFFGWLIILGVGGFVAWFFLKKYRRTKKKDFNLLDRAKKGTQISKQNPKLP